MNITDAKNKLLQEIKINNPNIITAYTAGRRNTKVKVRILEKFWEEDGDKMFWGEYPKGVLDLVFYDNSDNDYSVDHNQDLDELIGYYIEGNPYHLYKNTLLKYKLKPNYETSRILDDLIKDWDENKNLQEIKINNPNTIFRVTDKGKEYIEDFVLLEKLSDKFEIGELIKNEGPESEIFRFSQLLYIYSDKYGEGIILIDKPNKLEDYMSKHFKIWSDDENESKRDLKSFIKLGFITNISI